MPEYQELYIRDGIAHIHDDGANRFQVHLPVSSIDHWLVDWETKGGEVTLVTKTGGGFTITFEDGDHGAACSDALQALDAALQAETASH